MELGVNIDHVATLRQARGAVYPRHRVGGRIGRRERLRRYVAFRLP